MNYHFKYIISLAIVILVLSLSLTGQVAHGLSVFQYIQGGTGTTTAPISQLLYGGSSSYQSVATTTVTPGSGISFSAFTTIGSSPITVSCTGCSGASVPNVTYLTQSGTRFYIASTSASDNLSWFFNNGFVSNASSTQVAAFRLPSLSQGSLYLGSTGLVNTVSTSTITASTGLSYSGTFGSELGGSSGNLTVNTSQNIATLSNLTTNGFITTAGGVGTLGVQTFPISVAQGGTAAITLTGCLTGNGTGAITGSGTCNTSNASVSSVGLSSTNSTLTIGSTPVTTTGTITADLNLGNANIWTALQRFGNASTTLFSVFNKAYFGGTATTTIDSTGNIVIPSGSNLTVTGKTDGCATWATGVLNSTGTACGSGGGSGVPDVTYLTQSGTRFYQASTTATDNLSWYFGNGFVSNASSTFSGAARFPSLSQGIGYIGSTGLLNSLATSTLTGTGLISVTSGAYILGGTPIVVSCSTCGTGTLSAYDPFTHAFTWQSASSSLFAIGTTTSQIFQFVIGSSTVPQLSLSDNTAGDAQWIFRNAGQNLYLATTTAQGIATSTAPALSILNSGFVGIGTSTPFGNLSIHAPAQALTTPYFVIGSSSATAFSLYPSAVSQFSGGTTTPAFSSFGNYIWTAGASATTTVTMGSPGDSTSKTCYNTKTSAGTNASWFITGAGVMVVELNLCR